MEDFASEEYLENMRIYINSLDEDIRTDDIMYRDRLMICEKCDQLNEGICRICGCFVEYRAAVRIKGCPASEPKW